MFDGIFGDLFDLDRNGEIDAIEAALECVLADELLNEESEDEDDG